jgi:broad specificity phosphatase PhoE
LREFLEDSFTCPVISIDLLRHGQTQRNAARLFTGASETPLTPLGWKQARQAASDLSTHYDVAVHTHLARSRHTLETALRSGGVTVDAVIEDPRLAERSLGVLEGQRSHPIRAYHEGDFSWAPPGGNNYFVVTQRVLSFLVDMRAAARRLDRPLRAVICSHMGPMRILVAISAQKEDPVDVLTGSFPNARVIRLTIARLAWPRFLSRSAVLSERGGDRT